MSTTYAAPTIYDRPIAVAGATGKQGGAVAARLLARGHNVRALTRNPEKESAKALAEAGAEVVRADLEDRASLDRALKGAAALFSVQDFLEAGVEAERRQGANLTAAAAASSVGHIVYSGASTMDRNTGVPHLDSKWEIEKRVRALDIPWTVFRPAAFMENWAWERDAIEKEGVMNHPGAPDMIYRQVSVRDIAAMAAVAFENPSIWAGNIAPLAGDAMTPVRMADVFSRVMDREIVYKRIDWDDCMATQGEELTLMYRYFDEFGMDGDPRQLRRWHPGALAFEQFLREDGWAPTSAAS